MFLFTLVSSLELNNSMTVAKWVFTTYLMLHIQKTNLTYLWLFVPLNDLMCGHWTSGVVIEQLCRCWTNKKALLWNSSFKSCMIQRKIKTSFEIESQMTLDVVKLRQFRIYGTRVQRFSHVLVKLIRYYDWYRLIVDFHKKKITKKRHFSRSCVALNTL